jgi:hypothetical protein
VFHFLSFTCHTSLPAVRVVPNQAVHEREDSPADDRVPSVHRAAVCAHLQLVLCPREKQLRACRAAGWLFVSLAHTHWLPVNWHQCKFLALHPLRLPKPPLASLSTRGFAQTPMLPICVYFLIGSPPFPQVPHGHLREISTAVHRCGLHVSGLEIPQRPVAGIMVFVPVSTQSITYRRTRR